MKTRFVIVLSMCLMACNNPVGQKDGLTDIDGNVYKTVKIGDQVWMAENLKTTKFSDGTPIPLVEAISDWTFRLTPAFCYYNNTTNVDSINKFGALYNWFVVNTGKLAPKGWHIPDTSDWNKLEFYLSTHGYNWTGSSDPFPYGKIAKSLAAKTDWRTGTDSGGIGNDLTKNNSSGFSALPGGCRTSNTGIFDDVGDCVYWWSTSTSPLFNSCAECRSLNWANDGFPGGGYNKSTGFSVRLIKD